MWISVLQSEWTNHLDEQRVIGPSCIDLHLPGSFIVTMYNSNQQHLHCNHVHVSAAVGRDEWPLMLRSMFMSHEALQFNHHAKLSHISKVAATRTNTGQGAHAGGAGPQCVIDCLLGWLSETGLFSWVIGSAAHCSANWAARLRSDGSAKCFGQ